MDLRALIAKMDEIESKKILTESDDRKPAKKQEREVELPSGAKVKATKVQGWQSQKADKEADKERKKNDEGIQFRSAIANALLKEFGYSQVDEGPLTTADGSPVLSGDGTPWQSGKPAGNTSRVPNGAQGVHSRYPMPEAPAAGGTANPWEGKDPAKAAAWAALSPEDQKWLGMADPTDKIILARAPSNGGFLGSLGLGKKKPEGGGAAQPAKPAAPTGTTAQGDDEGNTMITKPDGTTQVVGPDGNVIKPGTNPNLPQNKPPAPAPAPTSTQVQTDDEGNHMITTPDGKTVVVGADGKPLPNGGKIPQGSAALDPAKNPNPATNIPGGPETAAGGATTTPPSGGAAAQPAKPAAPKGDPKVIAYQQELIKKGAKIKADGIYGPATNAAAAQFGMPPPAGIKTTANAGGPTKAPAGGATPPAKPGSGGAAAQPASPNYKSTGPRGSRQGPQGQPAVQDPSGSGKMGYMQGARGQLKGTFVPFTDSVNYNEPAIQEELASWLRIAGLR
jgi:hypothetical protein